MSARCGRRPARSARPSSPTTTRTPSPQGPGAGPVHRLLPAASTRTAFDQGLGDLITEVQATSRASSRTSTSPRSTTSGPRPSWWSTSPGRRRRAERTLFDIYVLLTFVEVDGDWKVDQVTDLNFARGSRRPRLDDLGDRHHNRRRPGTLSGPSTSYVSPARVPGSRRTAPRPPQRGPAWLTTTSSRGRRRRRRPRGPRGRARRPRRRRRLDPDLEDDDDLPRRRRRRRG